MALEIKTPLSKLHRATRRIADGFTASPGVWAYVTTGNVLTNVAATSTQPKVLKMVLGNASSNTYESNDLAVGSIATVEGVFRAAVGTNGYQKFGSDGTSSITSLYTQGAALSVAYTTATNGTDADDSLTADLGKLKPAITGEIVVARVENIDNTNNVLTFETVTPYPKA